MEVSIPTSPPQRLTREEWQAKRALKREKQRSTNLLRAKKMHALRPERESRAAKADSRKARDSASPKAALHIGCSGWFYWHWRERFYPRDLPTKDWFRHYTKNFSTVELNAPFYAWPTVATVNSWVKQAGRKRFVYTVKVCELITHVKKMRGTRELVRDFGLIADLLGPRFGCFLFQFPPSFRYTPARLKSICAQLEPHRRNVVEFRHKSWWNLKVYAALKAANIIFCSCSGPRLPDELIRTAEDIYIRFHGTKKWYRHDYSEEELAVWMERIRQSTAKNVWAYFNNDRDGHAIHNAQRLEALLRRRSSRRSGRTSGLASASPAD